MASGLFETERGDRRWLALGLASAPGLRASARHHFAWAREQARRDPENWSPELLCGWRRTPRRAQRDFDNLGEAAEIQMGADPELGEHESVTR